MRNFRLQGSTSFWLEAGARHNYPNLEDDGKGCIGCGFCVRACPVDAVVLTFPQSGAVDVGNIPVRE